MCVGSPTRMCMRGGMDAEMKACRMFWLRKYDALPGVWLAHTCAAAATARSRNPRRTPPWTVA
eukprot:365608-Chlamydomonas_euryale.AAC.31